MWLLFAILAAILWGLNYTLAERILHYISPITLLALEMLFGGLIFFAISYFIELGKDVSVIMSEPNLLFITIAEIIIVIFASLFIVYSIQAKNATVAGIVELIYPFFTILFTWMFFRESHLSMPVYLGGSLILIGVFIISFA